MTEVEQMFDLLSDLGVDGHTISPGYEYDAAKKDMIQRLNLQPEDFFLTRKMTIEKFQQIEQWMNRYTLLGTPIYFEFLAGKRDLSCSAWAIPTRNIRGWKGPCYLMTDAHYASYAELLEKVEWEKYGVIAGVARDSRCASGDGSTLPAVQMSRSLRVDEGISALPQPRLGIRQGPRNR